MTSHAFDELDYDYAASVAQKAMQCMAEQRVPATPDNFNVWFVYSWAYRATCSAPSIF